MRVLGVVTLAAALSACTSVKMVQRDGCWIKRTERIFGRVQEEIGPCTRPQPAWVQDQLTRLVQECVAQADFRWQVRALEAWSKSDAYPAQPPQEEILRTCMEEARVGLVKENEELKRRVADLSTERETLRIGAEQDRASLRASHDKIAEYLGEAALKPPGAATATASATGGGGNATNETGATLASESGSAAGARDVPGAGPAVPAGASDASGAPAPSSGAPPASPDGPAGAVPGAPAPAPSAPAAPKAVPPSPPPGPTAAAPPRAKIVRARKARVVQAGPPSKCEAPPSRAAEGGAPCGVAGAPEKAPGPRP